MNIRSSMREIELFSLKIKTVKERIFFDGNW